MTYNLDPVSKYLNKVLPFIPIAIVIMLVKVARDDPYRSEYTRKVLVEIGAKLACDLDIVLPYDHCEVPTYTIVPYRELSLY